MPDRIRKRVIVGGVVQGVWFRASALDEARRLGVDGWVRNLPDGRVEAVFEGSAEVVDAMVAWARQGPPRAVIERAEVIDEPVQGDVGFDVR